MPGVEANPKSLSGLRTRLPEPNALRGRPFLWRATDGRFHACAGSPCQIESRFGRGLGQSCCGPCLAGAAGGGGGGWDRAAAGCACCWPSWRDFDSLDTPGPVPALARLESARHCRFAGDRHRRGGSLVAQLRV